jgi:flagellar basal body rod protein FlgF
MPYEYELIIDGKIRRRDNSEFRPNVIAIMVEDMVKLSSKNRSFEMKIKMVEHWQDLQKKMPFR